MASSLPVIEKCRLGEVPDDAAPEAIAANLHRWEAGFLEDVRYVTEDPEGKEGSAYQMGDDGQGGTLPFVVDYPRGGGHLLTSDATSQFIRLKLIRFDSPPMCDGSCGLDDDDDDDWPSLPGECTCADLALGIRLSERGKAVLAALSPEATQ